MWGLAPIGVCTWNYIHIEQICTSRFMPNLMPFVWHRMDQKSVKEENKRKLWGWNGHTFWKLITSITRQALRWNPQGTRQRSQHKNAWRGDLEADVKQSGLTWKQLEKKAQDRGAWWTAVNSLYALCNGAIGVSKWVSYALYVVRQEAQQKYCGWVVDGHEARQLSCRRQKFVSWLRHLMLLYFLLAFFSFDHTIFAIFKAWTLNLIKITACHWT